MQNRGPKDLEGSFPLSLLEADFLRGAGKGSEGQDGEQHDSEATLK